MYELGNTMERDIRGKGVGGGEVGVDEKRRCTLGVRDRSLGGRRKVGSI